EKVADEVRPVIAKLVEVGATGKVTTAEDEERFEKAREEKIREQQVTQARSALKALAMAAQKKEAPREEVHEPQKAAETEPENGNKLDQRVKSPIQESLDRVRNLNVDELRDRLGGKMSEEQLQKLAKKLSTMSPEDLASFAAGLPSVQQAGDEKESSKTPSEEPVRESVIVD
ncbi:unnamed protein product, partial [Symbiodinium sp. KB8]